jgi:hypothetical protein
MAQTTFFPVVAKGRIVARHQVKLYESVQGRPRAKRQAAFLFPVLLRRRCRPALKLWDGLEGWLSHH